MSEQVDWNKLPPEACEIGAMTVVLRALAEVGLRWGWTEEKFLKLAKVVWRWQRDGEITDPDVASTVRHDAEQSAGARVEDLRPVVNGDVI